LAGVAIDDDPDHLATLFSGSLARMTGESPNDPPPTEADIADMIERSQDDLRAKRQSPDSLDAWLGRRKMVSP
jgi:hypothetical protein